MCSKSYTQTEILEIKFERLDSLRVSTMESPFYKFYQRRYTCKNCRWTNEDFFKQYKIELDSIRRTIGDNLSELISNKKNAKILIDKYTLNRDSKLLNLLFSYMDIILIKEEILDILFLEIKETENKIRLAVLIDYLSIKNNLPQRFGTRIERTSKSKFLIKPHLPNDKINFNRKMLGLNTIEEVCASK